MDIFIIIILLIAGIILGIALTMYFSRKKNAIPIDAVEVIDLPNESNIAEIKSEELLIGNPVSPDITIRRLEPNALIKTEDIPLNIGLKAGIGSLLQQAPNLLSSSSNIVTHSFQLVFKPEVMQGLQNNTYNIMHALEGGLRAKAIDGSGKIVGDGRIIETSAINPATTALAVWQVLAIITAQKFLSDINKKLAQISETVESLRDFLENERYGKLMGNLNYLRHLYNTMSSYNLKEREINIYAQKIEDIELECDQIMKSLQISLEIPINQLRSADLDGVGLKDHLQFAKDKISLFENNLKPYLMAMYIRVAAAQTKCALPMEKISSMQRIEELKHAMKDVERIQDNFSTTVNDKIPELKGFWSFDETDIECQNDLQDHFNSKHINIKNLVLEMKETITKTNQNLTSYDEENCKPLSLIVYTDDNGEIQEIKKLTE